MTGRARAAIWGMRILLAAVYLAAAAPKVIDPWGFTRAIHNFRIAPIALIPAGAILLPVLEGIAALAVLTGLLYRGGVLILTLFSGGFAAAIVSVMIRGIDIDCGCFGSLVHSRANLSHLGLNAATAAIGIILLRAARTRGTPRSPR